MKLGHLLRVLVVRAPASQSADQEDRHGDGRDAKHRTGPGPPEDVAGKVLATAGGDLPSGHQLVDGFVAHIDCLMSGHPGVPPKAIRVTIKHSGGNRGCAHE